MWINHLLNCFSNIPKYVARGAEVVESRGQEEQRSWEHWICPINAIISTRTWETYRWLFVYNDRHFWNFTTVLKLNIFFKSDFRCCLFDRSPCQWTRLACFTIFKFGYDRFNLFYRLKIRSETAQTDHLTNSGLRFNNSCNAIDLGIECELVCWNESVDCGFSCGRNSSDPVVRECKEKCIHEQFIYVDGRFTIYFENYQL